MISGYLSSLQWVLFFADALVRLIRMLGKTTSLICFFSISSSLNSSISSLEPLVFKETETQSLQQPLLSLLQPFALKSTADRLATTDIQNDVVDLILQQKIDYQRQLFLQGLEFAKQGNLKSLDKIRVQLLDYPLVDYLEQAAIKAHPEKFSYSTVARFIDSHSSYPFYHSLRQSWLKYLAQKKQWDLFQRYFKSSDSEELNCLLVSNLNDIPDWNEKVTQLWLSPHSLPKSCNPAFKRWKKNQQLTSALIWQRLNLAVEAREFALAKYLRGLLPKNQRADAHQLIKIWQRPDRFPKVAKRLYDNQQLDERHLQQLIQKFIWRNPQSAYEHWAEFSSWSESARPAWHRSLALSLATGAHPEATDWLISLPKEAEDETTRHWLLSSMLSANNWQALERLLGQYTQTWPEHLGYQYWLSQTYLKLNKLSEAESILQRLALQRHYYGFLAAKQLNITPRLNHQSSLVNADLVKNFESRPGFQRAKELWKLKLTLQARREWHLLIQDLDEDEVILAAIAARKIGWNDRAITLLANSKYTNEVLLRFPMPFFDAFEKNANQFDLPLSYTYAIARQESAFQVDAYSNKGARGLMQLKPATAKHFSTKHRLSYAGKKSLFQPDINLTLGTAYLKQLYQSNQQSMVYAAAAYNAGENALKKWRQRSKDLPQDIWIESIPYAETRNYVKQVISFELIYNELLNQRSHHDESTQLFSQLTP